MVGPRHGKACEKYSLTAKVLKRPESIVLQVREHYGEGRVYGIALPKVLRYEERPMENACGAE